MQKQQVLSLCSGIGGFELAMQLANSAIGSAVFESVALCEINPYCQKVLNRNFPGVPVIGDIRNVTVETIRGLGITRIDGVVGGIPCFHSGTLIFTEDGYKEIELIKVGDKVLTHKGKWKPVTSVMARDDAPLWIVQGQGVTPTLTTEEHPYFARRKRICWDNKNRKQCHLFSEPEWVNAGELDRNCFLGLTVPPDVEDGHSCDFWYLIGLYLADGWRSRRLNRSTDCGRVAICANKKQADYVSEVIKRAGFHPTAAEERTVIKFFIASASLYRFLEQFGSYAHGKSLPAWVLGLPKEKLQALIKGYLFGDGYTELSGTSHITTVSHKMALSLSMAIQKAFGVVASVRLSTVPPVKQIEGRIVNQRPFYRVTIPVSNQAWRSFVENSYAWKRIRSVKPTHTVGTVYNISVADDESYIANGAIVHNCQPFSAAGKQKGEFDERNLFPEFFRILRDFRPQWAIIENVPGLLANDSGRFFRDVLWNFTKEGYSVTWDIVSCAEMGGVHKRDRIWIIAYRSPQHYPGIGLAPIPNGIGRDDWADYRQGRHIQDDEDGCVEEGEPTRNGWFDRVGEIGATAANSRCGEQEECDVFDYDTQTRTNITSQGSDREDVAHSNGARLEKWQCGTSGKTSIGESERPDRIPCNSSEGGCKQQLQEAEQRGKESRVRNGVQQNEEAKRGVRGNDDGLPFGVDCYLMTPEDLPDMLPYSTDSENISHRKERLQALGNAIVPQVGMVAFLVLHDILTQLFTTTSENC